MLDPATESAMRARFTDADFARWMGLELVSLGDGTSEIRLKLEPHHLNPGRIVHGGVVAGMLDVAAGLAHRTKLGPDATHVTVQLHINYLKAAGSGVVPRSTLSAGGSTSTKPIASVPAAPDGISDNVWIGMPASKNFAATGSASMPSSSASDSARLTSSM